ncbi:MAG: helix-turn-helix domain-containing protein [Phormidesmis sp.]
MKDKNDSLSSEDRAELGQAESSGAPFYIRADLGQELRAIMLNKRLKQRELAVLLNVQQPEVSHLFNRHFNRFTIDKLVQFLDRLGWVVKFTIHQRDNSSINPE